MADPDTGDLRHALLAPDDAVEAFGAEAGEIAGREGVDVRAAREVGPPVA